MTATKEPKFLTREQIESCHRMSLEAFGGQDGIRSEHGLESAIAQPRQLHSYTEADHFDIAGAYAFHLAESQAYIDGNKRTAILVARTYLEANGIDTSRLPEDKTYQMMIDMSGHKIDRSQVADFFRTHLQERQPEPDLSEKQRALLEAADALASKENTEQQRGSGGREM